jgi:hypothetical protein
MGIYASASFLLIISLVPYVFSFVIFINLVNLDRGGLAAIRVGSFGMHRQGVPAWVLAEPLLFPR